MPALPHPCTHSGSDLPQLWTKRPLGLGDTGWPTAALAQPWVQRALPWNLLSSLPVLQGGLNSQPALLFVGQTDRENSPAPGGWSLAASQGPWQPPPRDKTIYPLGHYRGPTGVSPASCLPPCIHRSVKGKDRGRGGLGDRLFCHLSGDRSPSKRLRASWMVLSTKWGFGDYLWISFICVSPGLSCCR